jgi:hypothetical protein
VVAVKYMLFYKGPATPPDASHEGWKTWFGKLGDAFVDQGSPMVPEGIEIHGDGSTGGSVTGFNGYSVIRADSRDHALDLVKDHPYLQLGSDHAIGIYEIER